MKGLLILIKNKKLNFKKNDIKSIIYLAPSLLVFILFMVIPLLYTVYLSFFKWNMVSPEKEFVGLENYISIFQNKENYRIILNSLLYIVLLTIFCCVVPYILSFVLEQIISKFKNIYKSLIFIPSVISLVVASILFTWILNPVSGPLSIILGKVGLSIPFWSKMEGWVIVVISLITSWKVFGYNFIVLYASIAGISRELIEAAKLDNLSNTKIFLKIILPMSSATGVYIFIITIVQGVQYVFTPIKVITQGGPDNASSNLIYSSYQQAFEMYNTGSSSALSVITMIIFAVLLILEFKFVEKGVYYEN
ncbi:MAG TPA: sugar ABC transporter permease [Gallicola sp.]|nr:sugar ABC transporter permease [Gallicola sp.]